MKALITGVTGQDGSYLAEFLISKGYEVHGTVRRSSTINTGRIDHLISEYGESGVFKLHYADLLDPSSLSSLISNIMPDEVYNLAAQSHVAVSFQNPILTTQVGTLGSISILEAIRVADKEIKFYQASSSEMYGGAEEIFLNEQTKFDPKSPYAASKVFAHEISKIYRESYSIFSANGILFNHESPRRGETFVTRKISKAVGRIHHGLQEKISLGNMDASRDWGFAGDYIKAMWLMLQQDHLEDYVIATGKTTSVKEFISFCCAELEIDLAWEGEGEFEKGFDQKTNKLIIEVSKDYYRPAEVDILIGSPEKAKKQLGWESKTSVKSLASIMVSFDRKRLA